MIYNAEDTDQFRRTMHRGDWRAERASAHGPMSSHDDADSFLWQLKTGDVCGFGVSATLNSGDQSTNGGMWSDWVRNHCERHVDPSANDAENCDDVEQ